MSNEWLKEYYYKLVTDKNIDLNRKDTFTNWSLFSLLGIIAIYGNIFSSSEPLPSIIRIIFLVISICVIMRFFSHSCICYDNIRKLNKIKISIEKFWMSDENGNYLLEIKRLIELHDHDRNSIDITLWIIMKKVLTTGFFIIFLIPWVLLIYEFIINIIFFDFSIFLWVVIVLILMVIYLLFEFIILKSYIPRHK